MWRCVIWRLYGTYIKAPLAANTACLKEEKLAWFVLWNDSYFKTITSRGLKIGIWWCRSYDAAYWKWKHKPPSSTTILMCACPHQFLYIVAVMATFHSIWIYNTILLQLLCGATANIAWCRPYKVNQIN